MRNVNRESFTNAIRKGMGRAMVEVRPEFGDIVLDACLHDYRLDRLCEDSRVHYLFNLAIRADVKETLLASLLAAQPHPEEYQWYGLMARFAHEGEESARTTLRTQSHDGKFAAMEALVDAGDLLWVIENIVPTLPFKEKWRVSDWIERNADLPPEALRKLEYAEIEFQGSLKRPLSDTSRKLESFESIMNDIRTKTCRLHSLKRIGKNLTDAQVREVAECWLGERDPRRGTNYSMLFKVREYPFPIEPVIDLVRSGDPPVRFDHVVTHSPNPLLRELGRTLIANLDIRGYRCLMSSREEPDFEFLMTHLDPFLETDPNHVHGLCLEILGEPCNWSNAEQLDLMVWVYEHSPCSFCRASAVKRMVNANNLPVAYREEIQFDADSSVRELGISSSEP